MTEKNTTSNKLWFIGLFTMLLLMLGGMFYLVRSILPKKGSYFRTIRGEIKRKKAAPAPPLASFQPAPKIVLLSGKSLYFQHCVQCHGKQGMGDGVKAKRMIPKPTPYVWGEFRYGNRYKDIFRIITKGAPSRGSGMMAWKWLPEKKREALTHYVLYISARNARIIEQNKDKKNKKNKKR